MQKQGQCGVYKLYKLGKGVGNTFSNEFKKLERDNHVVTHDYAETINKWSTINGLEYEYNDAASKLYWKGEKYDLGTIEVVDPVIETVVSEKDDSEVVSMDDLKAEYETLSGKKAHHLWKEEKLQQEIKNLKS